MTTPNFTPDTEAQRWWKSLSFGEQMVQYYNAPLSSSIEAMYAIHLERTGDTTAPAPQGVDVPQWCEDAADEIAKIVPDEVNSLQVANIIASHAPQPEATPATAASDAGEVPATTPKWPRYFRRAYDAEMLVVREPGGMAYFKDNLRSVFHEAALEEYVRLGYYIETDAEGNALTREPAMNKVPLSEFLPGGYYADQPQDVIPTSCNVPIPKPQQASVERWTMGTNVYGWTAEKDSHGDYVEFADHGRIVREKDAELAELRAGVEGLRTNMGYAIRTRDRYATDLIEAEAKLADGQGYWKCYHCGFVAKTTAEADSHFGDEGGFQPLCVEWGQLDDQERASRLQEMSIELEGSRSTEIAAITRAEAAEMELAKAREELAQEKADRVGCWNNGEAKAHHLTAQLAAANERVAALEKERDGLREQVYELKNGDQP